MAITRTKLVAGVMLGGLVGGITLGGALRNVAAGPGDPPVIVLPSARAAQPAPVMIQAIPSSPMVPKLEVLPPPAELALPAKSPLPAAPPLLVPVEKPLQPAPVVPTLTPKEVAPSPQMAAQPSQGAIPSALAPPGESTMPMRTVTATALSAMIGSAPVYSAELSKPVPVIEKITDYARTNDVKSLKDEIEGLRKQVAALSGSVAILPKTVPVNDGVKADDVKSLKDEIEALRKQIAALGTDAPKASDVKALKDEVELLKKEIAGKALEQPKAADLKALKDEVASLKKDIAALVAKPADTTQSADAKAMKEEAEALRKDVQSLNTFLRETLEGKVEKGFTHDGVVKRLQKIDDSIAALTKKVQALENTRTAGSSPLKNEAAAHGIVRVVNEYPIEISIVVNGAAHRLDPSTRKDIPVPAGSFKYQLLTSGGAETERSIKESETVTLTIR